MNGDKIVCAHESVRNARHRGYLLSQPVDVGIERSVVVKNAIVGIIAQICVEQGVEIAAPTLVKTVVVRLVPDEAYRFCARLYHFVGKRSARGDVFHSDKVTVENVFVCARIAVDKGAGYTHRADKFLISPVEQLYTEYSRRLVKVKLRRKFSLLYFLFGKVEDPDKVAQTADLIGKTRYKVRAEAVR